MAGNNTPAPSGPTTFVERNNARFRDNTIEFIQEAAWRDMGADIAATFVQISKLTTNMIRGGTFRVKNVIIDGITGQPTIDINQIPALSRVLEMDILAVNGTTASEAATGVVEPAINFRLRADSTGLINAVVDPNDDPPRLKKAILVRVSGTDEERIASFPDFILEDHNYDAGDVFKYTFLGGETRLFEVRADMTMFQKPLPTGGDNDPYYRAFAPLTATAYDDSALQAHIRDLLDRLQGLESTVPVQQPTSRTLWVQGGGQAPGLVDGSRARPYLSVPQAHSNAADGDVICVMPGGTAIDVFGRRFYPEVTVIYKDVTIVSDPGVLYGNTWNLGDYGGNRPHRIRIVGGEWLSLLAFMKQANGPSFSVVEGARFTGQGYFLYFGNGGASTSFQDVCTLRNCFFDSQQPANGQQAVQLYGRDDFPTAGQLVLDSCLVTTAQTPAIAFGGHPDSRLVLRGTTELRPGAGKPAYVSVPNVSGTYPASTWLVDERPTGSGAAQDPRKDLVTQNGYRANTLVFEARQALTNPVLGPNAASFSAQLIKAAGGALVAVSAPRTGPPADVLAALTADFAGLTSAECALVYARFITTPITAGDEAHVLLTVSPA